MTAPQYPVLQYCPVSRMWRLVAPFMARAEIGYIWIAEGFLTDGASIPRALWRLIGHPMTGDYIGPAVIHDALYAAKLCQRDIADRIFFELLMVYGVGVARAWVMYAAVRAFGWAPWGARKTDAAREARRFVRVS